ncbi:hypothetical protein [Streptomyces sp. TLI_146]|uniref:hypothetical protein n=1 Tax=Streptomyces sp. TLI_146 TaxID=1938858 RepID=UPI000C70F5BD|nr:hypothetical protein [Streptomyces sp. TLI_146]PKV89998.1 hypothetical protein BX283_7653 [Streptomyces sp. TLI_146]
MSRHIVAVGAALTLAAAALVGTTQAASADTGAHPAAPATKHIVYFSDQPLSTTKSTPVSALPANARAQLTGTRIKPYTDTPTGYKLRDKNQRPITDYRYRSSYVYAIDASCGLDGCSAIQQVRLRLEEQLRGGQTWMMIINTSLWSGPPSYFADYSYECGVNIKGERDKTCSTWRDDGADGPANDVAYDGVRFLKSMGTFPAIKFPMVNVDVTFADGTRAIGDDGRYGEKFRGWDVCMQQGGTEKLCPTSGTGD